MADISKCEGKNCPIKEKCYRFTVPSGMYQTYGQFEYDHEKKKCDYFWDNKNR